MPVSSGKMTVGTAAVQIPAGSTMPWTIEVHNDDNSDALYIGGPGVTATTGMQINKIERLVVPAGPLDRLYLVSTKAGHSASFISVTQGD